MPKVYPDISADARNIPTVPRLVLASDVMKQGLNAGTIDGGRTIREVDGTDTPIGDILTDSSLGLTGGAGLRPPNDEEYLVGPYVLKENVNLIQHGAEVIQFTHFIGFQIDVFRNNVPMLNLSDDPADPNGFTWDIFTGKFYPYVNMVMDEVLTIQAKWVIPDPIEFPVLLAGENKNNIIVDNSITFLTTFVNTRLRVFRNNILQSFKTDFAWDNRLAKLTLTIPPIADEIFLIKPY